jgi:hypothetical protein
MTVNEPDLVGQRRRPLTADELDIIRQRILVAADSAGLLHDAVLAIYAPLLADTGSTLDDLPAGERLNPADFAIPSSQWNAIVDAIGRRAQAWGTTAAIAMELINVMPSTYDDPDVATPDFELRDYRPEVYDLQVSRDAIDVIGACETHLDQLSTDYGPTSAIYLDALHSWHRRLAGLFSRNGGVNTVISKDGPMSLLVRTGGLTYGLIWHGATRRCTDRACDALIDDDGMGRPAHTAATVLDHDHSPSYRLDAARPGQWSFHS